MAAVKSFRSALLPAILKARPSIAITPGPGPRRTFSSLSNYGLRVLPKNDDSALLGSTSNWVASSLIRGVSSSVWRCGDVREPPLPQYTPREGEELEVKRARLLYQSRYGDNDITEGLFYNTTWLK